MNDDLLPPIDTNQADPPPPAEETPKVEIPIKRNEYAENRMFLTFKKRSFSAPSVPEKKKLIKAILLGVVALILLICFGIKLNDIVKVKNTYKDNMEAKYGIDWEEDHPSRLFNSITQEEYEDYMETEYGSNWRKDYSSYVADMRTNLILYSIVVAIASLMLLISIKRAIGPIIAYKTALAKYNSDVAEQDRKIASLISQEEYDRRVKVAAEEIWANSFDFLGIDEDQVNQVNPICVYGQEIKADSIFKFDCIDGKTRGSDHSATVYRFSENQIFIYKKDFSMVNKDDYEEESHEYFFKDIVTMSIKHKSSTVIETVVDGSNTKKVPKAIASDSFQLITAGANKVSSTFISSDETRGTINGMKQYLREKK
ncbi:MAG: hypothetical protein M0R40_10610 [Firmicutes bacterium]|nr:hypothetical protein [Bacillota bacterium]